MCLGKFPLAPSSPELVLWCLHAGPSAEGHLASLPQLNQTYYPNQIKNVAPFDYCLTTLSTAIGEFHVGTMWLTLLQFSLSKYYSVSPIPQLSG